MKSRILGTPLTQDHTWWKTACAVALLCLATAIASPAQTFTTLVDFDGTNGSQPQYVSLVQGKDGKLYGTTFSGGAYDSGTVFKVSPTGTLTTLYSFCAQYPCLDGLNPYAGLVLGTDGNFYGTAGGGGTGSACGIGCGTVFRITPEGTLTTLHGFNLTDGANPYAALVQATDGNFYGTTYDGANNNPLCYNSSCGTVFRITPSGTLTTLYSFCSQSNCTDGANPEAALVQATNGTLYGTTTFGGANSRGTVFSITPGGTLTTLYSFCAQGQPCTDGAYPRALVQATNGIFYGTTLSGGANDDYGTVFSITPGGTLTTLHSFDGTDGAGPSALVQATNGTFYGTTAAGGANDVCSNGCGTLFSITSAGTLTTLHSFDGTDGFEPIGGLVQATNGTLYGTTYTGIKTSNPGTIFSLAVGLGPFVETLPTSGKVGAAVTILGTNLTGATSVTFNGTAATFTVVTSTDIRTTVPSGATTGKVKVVTPHGTLSSNVSFRVAP